MIYKVWVGGCEGGGLSTVLMTSSECLYDIASNDNALVHEVWSPRGSAVHNMWDVHFKTPKVRHQVSTPRSFEGLHSHNSVWLPSHCEIAGNEEADSLSKTGSQLEQFNQPVTYREAQTTCHKQHNCHWTSRLNVSGDVDPIHQMYRHQKIILF